MNLTLFSSAHFNQFCSLEARLSVPDYREAGSSFNKIVYATAEGGTLFLNIDVISVSSRIFRSVTRGGARVVGHPHHYKMLHFSY